MAEDLSVSDATLATNVAKIKQFGNSSADYPSVGSSVMATGASVVNSIGAAGTGLFNNASALGTSALGSLTTAASGVSAKISSAFNDAKNLVTKQTETGDKSITEGDDGWKVSEKGKYAALVPIGRPCRFNSIIDPQQRFGNYLRTKMSVIDLIPVDYSVDYTLLTGMANEQSAREKDPNKSSSNKNPVKSIYKINYDKKIEQFQGLIAHHGLPKGPGDGYCGIRLYTTDDTTANDSISVNYKDSTFQGFADKLTDMGQKYRDFATSIMGTGAEDVSNKINKAATNATGEIIGKLGGNKAIQNLMESLTSGIVDITLKGNKITFPKIWQSTSYNGHLSVNIRLVSPYGHPNAVKEFILKPLSYLILLAAPRTVNGATYGGSFPVTIKGYGLNYTVLGAISSITFRRGGSDTSFNLYKQPLTLDISIDFQTLFDAFAVFDPTVFGKDLKQDQYIFKDTMLTDPTSSLNLYTKSESTHLMTSLGTILKSFRPVIINDTSVDPQVYGSFTPPDRSQIPEAASFTPLTGNLGSVISGAVSNIGNFASLITNAPSLIQSGLANAVYNTAKGSVGSIASTASGWISKGPAAASTVANTIKGNFL